MHRERGVALLEVLAAVVILGIAGLALVELTAGGIRATAAARQREQEVADAERLLTAYTLLRRVELDQRLGDRRVGSYIVNVQRPERELYRIAVGDLVTVVYHPEARDAR
jgi:type II secretory pathway pseudopilin PulG